MEHWGYAGQIEAVVRAPITVNVDMKLVSVIPGGLRELGRQFRRGHPLTMVSIDITRIAHAEALGEERSVGEEFEVLTDDDVLPFCLGGHVSDALHYAGSLYPDRVYTNISRSETQHQSAIRQLLVGYGLDDPTANTAAGEFQNPELQQLYYKLAKKVKKSATKAAKVGVIIEKTDIADLKDSIAASDSDVVKSRLSRLESASQNHLKAFTSLKARS
jgi:hypothetical protein